MMNKILKMIYLSIGKLAKISGNQAEYTNNTIQKSHTALAQDGERLLRKYKKDDSLKRAQRESEIEEKKIN